MGRGGIHQKDDGIRRQPGRGREEEIRKGSSRGVAKGNVPGGRKQTQPMHMQGRAHGSKEGKPGRGSTMEPVGPNPLEMQEMRRGQAGDEGRDRGEGEGHAAHALAKRGPPSS